METYNIYMDEAPAAGDADGDEGWEVEFRVVLRFAGNEVTEIERFATADEAKSSAHTIAAELAGARDEEWLIADFQAGETPTYVEHIRAGLRVLKEDPEAVFHVKQL